MDIFLNELSLQLARNEETAKKWMTDFFDVFKEAKSLGFKTLRVSENAPDKKLAENYSLMDWQEDPTVDKVQQDLFRIHMLNRPFLEEIFKKKEDEKGNLYEFYYKDQESIGLGAAWLFASLAVSLKSSIDWNTTKIPLRIYKVEEGEEVDKTEDVFQFSTSDHLFSLKKYIEDIFIPFIPNGKILWLKRKEFYPHLIFCDRVKSQVIFLKAGEPKFSQIKKRLSELEKYCSNWTSGTFEPKKIGSKVTPESQSREQDFSEELNVTCPDGKVRFFSFHSRFTPGVGRIHFYPELKDKKILIGYIGEKIF